MTTGRIDIVNRDRIAGWAWREDRKPLRLEILVNDTPFLTTIANGLRPDVMRAGAAPVQRCGFDVIFPETLPPSKRHVVTVRDADSGIRIGEPVILDPVTQLDGEVAALITRLAASADGDTRTALLRCLTDATAVLRARRACDDSGITAATQHRLQGQRGERRTSTPRPSRALVIDSRWPGRDAGSQAVRAHITALIALGIDVSIVASDEIDTNPCPYDCAGAKALASPFYTSVEDILRRQQDRFDVVYLHRESNATRYLGLARRLQPRARIIYSVGDLHGLRVIRQGRIEGRPELEQRGQLLLRDEIRAAATADSVITHSADEADLLHRHNVAARVVPWTIPAAKRLPPFKHREGVIFVGNYAHLPNLDAAQWLLDTIMPIVWEKAPSISCTLLGDEMPSDLIARASARVRVVPGADNLQDHLNRARLNVAPLRYGAGVKGKVLESFGAGIPCLMSPIAAEGIRDWPPALNELVFENAKAFAEGIVRLHDDRPKLEKLGRLGLRYIASSFNESAVRDALSTAIR